eukprot:3803254-Prymnesium_polylepis.2
MSSTSLARASPERAASEPALALAAPEVRSHSIRGLVAATGAARSSCRASKTAGTTWQLPPCG